MESLKLGNHIEDSRGEGCLDRISSLPDELLAHVLSFLPTTFAVSTSILSTRWRYIFTLTSCLSFDDESSFCGPIAQRQIHTTRKGSFKEFVYNVLGLHISPIKKFSLVCGVTYDKSDLYAWVSNAVQKGVQEIHYKLAEQAAHMPYGLAMCKTLVTLKILSGGCRSIEMPLSVSLPNLKILHLNEVQFHDCDSIQRFFSGCSKLLEELSLVGCYCIRLDSGDRVIVSPKLLKVLFIKECWFGEGWFEIDAPNLAYFTYNRNTGMRIVPSWKFSSSLVKAKLQFIRGPPEISVSLKHDREIFKAAAYKTTELRLKGNSVEYLLKLEDGEQMPDFLYLTTFHLHQCRYDTWKYVTSLIGRSPQLETIIFDEGFYCSYCSSSRKYSPLTPSDIPLDPFSCNVQVIEVGYFCHHEGPLSLMGHLLRNASSLKRVIIHTSTSSLKTDLKITKNLNMLPKASKDCRIEIRFRD